MKRIRTATEEIHVDEQGIIYKKIIEGVHIGQPEVIEAEDACALLAGTDKYLVMVDATAVHTMTPEAVAALTNTHSTNRIATAVYSNRTGIRILVDYFAKFEKMGTPIKLFQCPQEAKEWLLTFKKK